MKTTVHEFTPPHVVGALGDTQLTENFAKAIERELKKRDCFAICLPFQVETRYLKNIVACMRLMDVIGLAIHPSHQRRIGKHLNEIDPLARKVGFVDTVIRRGRKFVGLNVWARALRTIVEEKAKRSIVIIGNNQNARMAVRALEPFDTRSLKRAPRGPLKDVLSGALVFDFRERSKSTSYKDIIRPRHVEKMQRRIAVDLIISSIFRHSRQK